MKKTYAKHRASMSETGQGLLDARREDEIINGSEIANIWGRVLCDVCSVISHMFVDDIKLKFPWYMWMHALMGASPVVSRSAIANSRTPIDFSMLYRETDGQVF